MRRVCALLHDRQLEDFIDMDTISETKTETKKPKKPKKAEKAEVVKSGDPLLDEGSTTKRYDPAGLMARIGSQRRRLRSTSLRHEGSWRSL